MIDTSQLSYQSNIQQTALDRLRTELFSYTDKLETALNDEQTRQRERQVLTLSNELKDTVSSLLQAAANNNPELLKSILSDKMGEEFVRGYSDIIQRFHVEKNTSVVHKPAPKEEVEREIELPPPRQGLSKALSMGDEPTKKQSGGILKNVWGMFGKKGSTQSKPTQIILNENEPKVYYCSRRKKYVIEGEEDVEEKPIGPPPKKTELKGTSAEPKKPETEMDSMIAPPPFMRGRKKGPKQERIVKQMVLEELPPVMDFSEFRRKMGMLFEEATSTQQQSGGYNTKVVDQFVEKLYSDLQQEQQLAASIAELMRDSYELLLSNSRFPPSTQITILNQNHSNMGMLDALPKNKAHIISLEEENGRLKSMEMQYQLERSNYEAIISDYVRKVRELEEALERQRTVLEERIREREESVSRLNEETQDRRSEVERIEGELEGSLVTIARLEASSKQLKRSIEDLSLQLSTKEAELQNRDSIIKETSDNLEESRYQLRKANEQLKIRDSKIRSLEVLIRESESTLNQHRNNEESLKRCYSSVLKSKASLAQMAESLANQNILLEKIKKRRSILVQSAAASDARVQRQLALEEETSTERPASTFLEMSSLVNDVIIRSTTTMRDYQGRTKQLIQELNSVRQQYNSHRQNTEAKIKSLNSQILKVKVAMDGYKAEAGEATAKLDIMRKDKLRLEKELDKFKHDSNFSKGLLEQATKNSGTVSKKNEELLAELAKLRKQKEKADAAVKLLESQNSELTTVLKAIEEEKEVIEEEKDTISEELFEIREQKETASREAQQLKALLLEVRSQLESEEAAKEAASKLVERLKAELLEAGTRAQEQSAVKESLQKDYEQLYDSYNEVDALLKELTAKYESETSNLSNTVKVIQENSQREITTQLAQVGSLTEQIATLNGQIILLRNNLSSSQQGLISEQEKNAKTVQDITNLIAELESKGSELDQVTEALGSTTVHRDQLIAECSQLSAQLSQLAAERDQLIVAKGQVHSQVELLQSEYQQYQNESVAAIEELGTKLRQLEELQDKKIEEVVEEMAKGFDKERQDLAREYEQKLVHETAASREQLQSQLTKLSSSIEEMLQRRSDELTLHYNQQLLNIDASHRQILELLRNTEARLSESEVHATRLATELEQSQNSLNESQAVLVQLDEDLQKKAEELEQKGNELESARQELLHQQHNSQRQQNQLVSQLNEKDEERNGLLQDIEELRVQVSDEKTKVTECILVIRKHEENEQTKGRIISLMERDLLTVTEERKGLEEIIGRLSKENESLKYQIEASNEMNKALSQTEIDELQSKNSELELLIEAINEELVAKQKQNEQLTESLETEKQNGSMLSVRISQLVGEMLQFKQHTAQSGKYMEELEAVKAKMLEDHARYEACAAKMKEEIAEVTFESEEMKSFYEKKLTECNNRIAELTDARVNHAVEVEDITMRLSQQLENFKQENMRQLDSGKQLVFENRELQETVAALKEELAQQQQKQPVQVSSQPPIDEGFATQLEQMIEKQQEEIARLEATNCQLTKQIESLKQQEALYQQREKKYEEDKLQLQTTYGLLVKEMQEVKKQQFKSSQSNEETEREAGELKMMLQNLDTELEDARATISKLTTERNTKERQIFLLQAQAEKLKEVVSDKNLREAAYEEKITRLEADLSQSKASEFKKLQEKVKTLELENEELLVIGL